MRDYVVKLESELAENVYRAWYRCVNCGVIFQYDMQKGVDAKNMKGECPICGIKSGRPGVGSFQIVKYNPKHDAMHRHYFK